MHRSITSPLVFALVLVLASGFAWAEESGVTAKLHPWGRFDPGCWKLVRVISETLDEQGQVSSTCTTDTRTTLMDIENDGVTLDIAARMEVAGKRFQSEPQTIKQGFHGEAADLNLSAKPAIDSQITIGQRVIPCKVQELEAVSPKGKTSIKLYYSPTVAPYVLKRECVTTSTDGTSQSSETTTEVTAIDMPVRLNEEMKDGIHVRTVHKNGKGTITTLAVVVPEVPGGVVSHTSKEVDKTGRLVRRSTLELLDYCRDPESPHSRKRSNRRAKSPY